MIVESDQAAADENNQGAFGEIVVSDSASAAGIGSIPSPLSEIDADFLVYQPFQYSFKFQTGSGFETYRQEYVVDSKSMRKVGHDDDLVQVAEQRIAVGGFISVEGRTLIQLH